MTWINSPPVDDPPKGLVVPAPRDVDAIGAALAAAYDRPGGLPADITEPLRELEHIA